MLTCCVAKLLKVFRTELASHFIDHNIILDIILQVTDSYYIGNT